MDKLLGYILLAIALSACAPKRVEAPSDTGSLASLEAMGRHQNTRSSGKAQGNKIRTAAIRETALTLGAQSGLAWRAKFIDEELTNEARRLDSVYNFQALMLPHNIIPPVLLEGRRAFNMANTQTIRVSDRTYKISKQARFTTSAPNWCQYLWMDYKQPDKPNLTLLPRNRSEQAVWTECIRQGWKNGVEQANIILEENIARIKEDFTGMILYRKLLAMNMVSPPYVSQADLGITGDENSISIDDKVLRIAALPALNTNANSWRAPVAVDKDKLKQYMTMEKQAKKAKIDITSKSWQPVISPDGVISKPKYPNCNILDLS